MRVRNFVTKPKTCPLNYNSQCVDKRENGVNDGKCVFLNKEDGSNKVKQMVESVTHQHKYVTQYKLGNWYNMVSYFPERSEYKCSCDSGLTFPPEVGSRARGICSCNQGFESDGKNCKTMCDGGFDTHDPRLDKMRIELEITYKY